MNEQTVSQADSPSHSRANASGVTGANHCANHGAETAANPATDATAKPIASISADVGIYAGLPADPDISDAKDTSTNRSTTPAAPQAHADPAVVQFSRRLDNPPTRRDDGRRRGSARQSLTRPGVGTMGLRVRDPDDASPPREMIEEAKGAARASGHRFDLMRYLRLRRRR